MDIYTYIWTKQGILTVLFFSWNTMLIFLFKFLEHKGYSFHGNLWQCVWASNIFLVEEVSSAKCTVALDKLKIQSAEAHILMQRIAYFYPVNNFAVSLPVKEKVLIVESLPKTTCICSHKIKNKTKQKCNCHCCLILDIWSTWFTITFCQIRVSWFSHVILNSLLQLQKYLKE